METAKKLVVLVFLMVALFEGSRATTLCEMNDEGLAACKPSVSQPNPVDPTPECCQALSGADLTCLCSYKDSPFLPMLGIDPGLAMKLPEKCNLNSPPECQGP